MFVCSECGETFERGGYCARDGRPLTETEDALIGREIGRYRIARLLAEGGMGRVYLGIQPQIGSRVAIKVLSEQSGSSDLLDRFFAEARAVNLIRHESIVSVLDMSKLDDGRPYIVMEYIEGQTLAELVRAGGAPLGGVVQVMIEVLSALAAAHAIGIVHRDLKPDNVLITGEGHAKVLDFGIAKLMPGLSQQLSPRTRTGALLGTPAYMAPEQISGSGHIDARTDIYAAGIVLFEAVTGRVPFAGETLFDLMRQHLEVAPVSPRSLRPDLPVAFEHVIMTALAKDPARRFQSAPAMSHALQQAASELRPEDWRSLSTRSAMITGGGRGPTSYQNAPTTRAAPTPRAEPAPRRRHVVWIAGMAATAVIAVLVTLLVVRGKTEKAPVPDVVEPAPGSASAPAAPSPPTPEAPPAPSPPPPSTPEAPRPGGKTVEQHGGVTIITTTPQKQLSFAVDYDPKHFDPVAYLPKALEKAQRIAPDAKLTRFEFDPVFSDGHVDLTMDSEDHEYDFRSEAGSKRPPGKPPNVPVDRPCRVHLEVTATGVTASLLDDDECDDKLVRHPRCHFAAVWQKAIAAGTPKDYVARIAWLFDEKWFFDTDLGNTGKGETSTYEDRCP